MENDRDRSSSVTQAIEDLQATLKEQSQTFKALTESIQMLTTLLELKQSESSITEGGDVKVYEEQWIRSQDQKAQESEKPFNNEDIYDTLTDPFPRSRQERIAFAMEAAQQYRDQQITNVCSLFEEVFMYRTEEHFKNLPNNTISNSREALLKHDAPIGRRPGLRISAALAQYLCRIRKNAFKYETGSHSSKDTTDYEKNSKIGQYYNDDKQSTQPDVTYQQAKQESRIIAHSRPGDVLKLFGNECRYSGGPTEPIKRRYEIFVNACRLCGVDTLSKEIMFLLMQTTFLRGPALVHFMDVIIRDAIDPNEVIKRMEVHFLDGRAKRVNNDVWMEISFELIKLKRAAKKEDTSHEKVLNERFTHILELSDIRTGSGSSSDIMAKSISAVRGVEAFELVYRSPPKQLQALNSVLRTCALEADRAALRDTSEYGEKSLAYNNAKAFSATAEKLFQAFLVDRKIKGPLNDEKPRRNFRGYGKEQRRNVSQFHNGPNNHNRVPWNVCIVCNKKGCHSSIHRNTGKQMFKRFARAYFGQQAEESSNNDEEVDSGGSNDVGNELESESYIAFTRVVAAMGLSQKETQWIVDGALIDMG